MLYSKRLKYAGAILGIAVAGTIATAAVASAGSGITPANLVTANLNEEPLVNHDRVKF